MKNIVRNALVALPVAALATAAQAQEATPGYAAQLQTIVDDGKGMLAVVVVLVIALAGFYLFKKIAHRGS